MPDNIDVQPEALYDSDTGTPILTRQRARQEHEQWTAVRPPIPGLRWSISFGIDGQVRSRHLEVIPGWEDAFAPPVTTRPTSAAKHALGRPDEANRLGALAYAGWAAALPDVVRESGTTDWADLAEPFREPLRQAAILVWQHAENAGFHAALLRTLPSAQLGAAGELDNLLDYIGAMVKLHGAQYTISAVMGEIVRRINGLRSKSDSGTKRARDQGPRQ